MVPTIHGGAGISGYLHTISKGNLPRHSTMKTDFGFTDLPAILDVAQGEACTQPRENKPMRLKSTKGKQDWEKPFYCSQEAWLRSSPLAAALAPTSFHLCVLSSLRQPPSEDTLDGSAPADRRQISRGEERTSSLPRGCGKKWTKARREIMEIVQFYVTVWFQHMLIFC